MSIFNKDGNDNPPAEGKKKTRRTQNNGATPKSRSKKAVAAVITTPEPELVRPPIEMTTQPLPPRQALEEITSPLPAVSSNGADKNVEGVPRRLICQNLEAAYASDVGRIRDNNEDSIAAFVGMIPRTENGQELLFGFFAVADGMGGYENGEIASNIAVRVTQHGVIAQFYQRSLQGLRPGTTGQMPGDVLIQIIEEANQAIVRESLANRKNMGTTLTCVTLIGTMAFIGHIGDSRLYGIEKGSGELRQLSKDHSLVARLVETGALTEQEAADSPQRSVLYRSLGQRPDTPADADFVRTTDYSYLLLCSDGLWDMLPDSSIQYYIKKFQDPATICQELINAANEAGGVDNISAIVIKL